MTKKIYGIILAAGKGLRMGSDIPKQHMCLGDKPVLSYSIKAFDEAPSVDKLVLVCSAADEELIRGSILDKYPAQKPVLFVEGGFERQESVYKALLTPLKEAWIVAIHDGVRPLITPETIEATIKAAIEYGAAVAGMPVKDTIKQVNEQGFATHTPDRSTLWSIQTPQTFQYDLIVKAHIKARGDLFVATDDSMLVERLGYPVRMIQGGYDNIKITTKEDMITASQLLEYRRGFL